VNSLMKKTLMKHALFIFFALFAINASATVYKCPTPDGKIEYRSKPCAEGERLEIRESAVVRSEESVRLQPGGGQIQVGMTTRQVRSIWGEPETITTRTISDKITESWWYTKNERRHLLTIVDGAVSSMSNHEPFGSRSASASEQETPVYKREPTIREREAQERVNRQNAP